MRYIDDSFRVTSPPGSMTLTNSGRGVLLRYRYGFQLLRSMTLTDSGRGVLPVDGIILDLGVSSMTLTDSGRVCYNLHLPANPV